MSESHEPGRRPAGPPPPPDSAPPRTGGDAAPAEPRAIEEPRTSAAGMEGEGAGENRDAAADGCSGGMLSQGGERDRKTGGMLGEG